MESIIQKLKDEPIRLRIYSLVLLVATYLVARGVISLDDMEFIIGIAGIVLAVETSRAKVKPLSKL